MNSQVRNTLTVLTICSALVLGLVVASATGIPAPQASIAGDGAASLATDAVLATVTAESPIVAGLTESFPDTAPTPAEVTPPPRTPARSRRIRQSMAMPFFSFARG